MEKISWKCSARISFGCRIYEKNNWAEFLRKSCQEWLDKEHKFL
jgi:hypothetical protein